MKKSQSILKIVLIILVVLMVFAVKSVFAADIDLNDPTFDQLTPANESGNSLNNVTNNVTNNTTNNTTNNILNNTPNTGALKTNDASSNYNKSDLPKTGVEDSMPIVVLGVIFVVSAVFAYKKIQYYKNV